LPSSLPLRYHGKNAGAASPYLRQVLVNMLENAKMAENAGAAVWTWLLRRAAWTWLLR